MTLILRDMEKSDLKFINDIRNHPSTRENLENNSVINYPDTLLWFQKSSPKWLIIEHENHKVGYVRVSDDTGNSICIGCDIHPDKRRRGHAFEAYNLLIDNLYARKYSVLWLKVFEKNTAAVNLYKKLGFKSVGFEFIRNEKYLTMIHNRV